MDTVSRAFDWNRLGGSGGTFFLLAPPPRAIDSFFPRNLHTIEYTFSAEKRGSVVRVVRG